MKNLDRCRRPPVLTGLLFIAAGSSMAWFLLSHALEEPSSASIGLIEYVLPSLLGLAMVPAGIWIARSDLEGDKLLVIVLWWLGGMAATGTLGAIMVAYEGEVHGVEIVHPVNVVVNNVAAGSVGGFLIGLYDVRSRLQRSEIEERKAVQFLNRLLKHGLRNDLQVALGMAEMLEGQVEEEGRRPLSKLKDSVKSASNRLEEASTFVKAIQGGRRLDKTPVHLGDAMDEVVAETEERFPDAEVAVEGDTDIYVEGGDPLPYVFDNLLTNAVKHNDKETPRVEVSFDDRGDSVMVNVADNGPGVPEDMKGAIFGRGNKGDESTGSGMGLYLIDNLVSAYGGDIWVEDNEPEGSVFRVELQRPER